MKNTTARGTVPAPAASKAEAPGRTAGSFLRRSEVSSASIASVLLCVACLAGCDRTPRQAPPRATDTINVPPQTSTVDVPIVADLDKLARSLEQAIPRRLWSIDKPGQTCLPPKKVKILFAKIKTPAIQCRITGTVVRGPLVLEGSGKTIIVTMPLHAAISARDVGGVLSRETAEADARVRAVIRLDIARDWSPRGTVSIASTGPTSPTSTSLASASSSPARLTPSSPASSRAWSVRCRRNSADCSCASRSRRSGGRRSPPSN